MDIIYVKQIEKIREETVEAQDRVEVKEGEAYQTEVTFRKRNRSLIQAKKANCHAMVHKKHPPISMEDLRKHIRW